jgi:hypothetical protein
MKQAALQAALGSHFGHAILVRGIGGRVRWRGPAGRRLQLEALMTHLSNIAVAQCWVMRCS